MTIDRLRSQLDGTGARTAVVRGASAPPRPPDAVTVAPGIAASLGARGRTAPLYVTATTPSGQSVREYDGPDVDAAADRAAKAAVKHDFRGVWLCERGRVRDWWGDGVADLLERRLATGARRADARLVVWTDDDGADADGKENAAVGYRYDVVLAP